ncbi:hypothetical protein G432_05135 [Sphingomonas sp. MM-1]|uniref:type II toxin-antitoxin system RelE/ParE family toxin n=1 Tax=Sphingomonas sp. MM-1 TaxID=745310 RepID=UPI0002C0D44E|nr:type II toxin-antitoxin system RelE/ParE family toxin [Sphingomonas sp. MM-1]AGH48754.1 hypothetical protein G432_05135 [Sphingomonas sp. MM-1]
MIEVRRTAEFADWLKGLKDRAAKARIEVRITRLALGNPGQHRNLTKGLREMKIDYATGYRVYFVERGNTVIVLLCGGDKKSQDRDIARALAMVEDLEE